MPFITPLRLLVMGFFALTGVMVASVVLAPPTAPYEAVLALSPQELVVIQDAPVTLDVVLSATTPINAFSGNLIFDTTRFVVQNISYNTSLADLWVTEPWYSKADNTIYFAGGTTRPGGFTGTETLLTVELVAIKPGNSSISIENARILKHDGLGTDAVVGPSIDSIVSSLEKDELAPLARTNAAEVSVLTLLPRRDVNDDGKVSLADVATLMLHLGTSNAKYDLNQDGIVSLPDLAIITAP